MAVITVHRSTPGADFKAVVDLLNANAAKLAALTAKLDADSGVGDTNYASTIGAFDTITLNC